MLLSHGLLPCLAYAYLLLHRYRSDAIPGSTSPVPYVLLSVCAYLRLHHQEGRHERGEGSQVLVLDYLRLLF